jgi:hypothetical protein
VVSPQTESRKFSARTALICPHRSNLQSPKLCPGCFFKRDTHSARKPPASSRHRRRRLNRHLLRQDLGSVKLRDQADPEPGRGRQSRQARVRGLGGVRRQPPNDVAVALAPVLGPFLLSLRTSPRASVQFTRGERGVTFVALADPLGTIGNTLCNFCQREQWPK